MPDDENDEFRPVWVERRGFVGFRKFAALCPAFAKMLWRGRRDAATVFCLQSPLFGIIRLYSPFYGELFFECGKTRRMSGAELGIQKGAKSGPEGVDWTTLARVGSHL